jgi:hypothetical protein
LSAIGTPMAPSQTKPTRMAGQRRAAPKRPALPSGDASEASQGPPYLYSLTAPVIAET